MLDWTGSSSRSLRPNHNLYNESSEIDIDLKRLETKRKSDSASIMIEVCLHQYTANILQHRAVHMTWKTIAIVFQMYRFPFVALKPSLFDGTLIIFVSNHPSVLGEIRRVYHQHRTGPRLDLAGSGPFVAVDVATSFGVCARIHGASWSTRRFYFCPTGFK